MIPGGVGDTQMMSGTDPAVFQSVGFQVTGPFQACMLGMCKPADIANAVQFLVTAPMVNRAELAVDHGWTVCLIVIKGTRPNSPSGRKVGSEGIEAVLESWIFDS